MLYITLALAAGFLAFAGSGFPPIRNFGVLTAITLATAFAANLVVLPALLATTKIITLWDLLGVKLGAGPHPHDSAARRPAAGAGAHRRA